MECNFLVLSLKKNYILGRNMQSLRNKQNKSALKKFFKITAD